VLEPITARNAPTVYNPSGIASNALAAFEIEVYPTTIPDDDITWSIAYGDLSFYNTGNKGRIAYVRGGTTEGDFKLEVDIANMTLDPKPHIYGRMVTQTLIPITICIVRRDSGSDPAFEGASMIGLLTETSKILKQAGIQLVINGEFNYTNRTDWLVVDYSNGYSNVAGQLVNIGKNTGGLETYFVETIGDGDIGGLNNQNGMVLPGYVTPRMFAHEVGHACGLKDIYCEIQDSNGITRVSEDISEQKMPRDWGEYSNRLKYPDVITKLLMFAGSTDESFDLPLGRVEGMWVSANEQGVVIYHTNELAPIGLESMSTRQPQHQ